MSDTVKPVGSIFAIAEIRGTALSVPGDDIDTDQIIASRYLRWITFDGLEQHVFEDARKASLATGKVHPLDDPRLRAATILLVGRNFGCGSSREHAPQALRRFGLKAIIGVSFGEIFAGNCVAVGLACVQVSQHAVDRLVTLNQCDPGMVITIDIAERTARTANEAYPLEILEGRRMQFLDGSWDALAQLLSMLPEIDALAETLPPTHR